MIPFHHRCKHAWAVLTGQIALPNSLEGMKLMTYLTQTAALIGQIQIAANAVIVQAEADHTAAANAASDLTAADQEGVNALMPVLTSLNTAESTLGLTPTPAVAPVAATQAADASAA